MKINNIKAKGSNKYVLLIDDKSYELYADVVIEYGLYNKKEITDDLLKSVLDKQNFYVAYNKILSFITYKMRTEKEVITKLRSYHLGKQMINTIINKLKENNYLNEEKYLESYYHDQINLSLKGPELITKELVSLGYSIDKINSLNESISDDIWLSRMNKIGEKKLKSNHKLSVKLFNYKLKQYLLSMGYSQKLISMMDDIIFDDSLIREKEYQRLEKKFVKKYNGEELERIVNNHLKSEGFY